MRPIFVRQLTEREHNALRQGLHSSSAFTVRRCQILLSSAAHKTANQIGEELHCSGQAVRNAIHAFEEEGVACLREKSHARHDQQSAFGMKERKRLREIIRLSPRQFGHESAVWTLDMLAETCWSEGIASRPVTADNVRLVLQQMGIRWRRAKKWIRSPDEHYEHQKKDETS
jgi:predicted ArsR family transcriptional regulator